jgi:cold shock CspA family protein
VNGTIVRLNAEKGFGFIKCSRYDYELYFRIPIGASFVMGNDVSFETETADNNKNKQKAVEVKLCRSVPASSAKRSNTGPKQEDHCTRKMTQSYYLPNDTAELLFKSAGVTIDNMALKLLKYLPIRNRGDEKRIEKPDSSKEYSKICIRYLDNVQQNIKPKTESQPTH